MKIATPYGEHHIYGHMSSVNVYQGQSVAAGDLIGYSGDPGVGAHIHFEQRTPNGACGSGLAIIDPKPLLTEGGGGSPADFAIGDKIEVLDGPLNMHSSPDLSANVIIVLDSAVQLCVIDGPTTADGCTWFRVNYGGTVGWVVGEFCGQVTVGGCISYDDGDKIEATAALHLRAATGFSSVTRTTVAEGAEMCVIDGPTADDGYRWYKVDASGIQGWVVGTYTSLVAADGCASIEPIPLPTSGIYPGDVLRVTSEANLRTAPSLSGDIMQVLPVDYKSVVVGGPVNADDYTWYQLDTRYRRGWAASANLTETSAFTNRVANPTADSDLSNISPMDDGSGISRQLRGGNYRVRCINSGADTSEGLRYDSVPLSTGSDRWFAGVVDVYGNGKIDVAKVKIHYNDGSSSTFSPNNSPVVQLSLVAWQRVLVPVVHGVPGKTIDKLELWIRRSDAVSQTFYTDNAKIIEV